MPKKRKKCKYCDSYFTPARKTQVFCSERCRRIFWDGCRAVDQKEFFAFLEWKANKDKPPAPAPAPALPEIFMVEKIADIPGIDQLWKPPQK